MQTQGEWKAIEWSRHAATTVVVEDATVTTGKRVIAECETTPEDALLIAAAPDLLASLIDILETFALGPLGAAAKYGPDVDLRAIEEAAVANARDVIAKATGQALT